MVKYIEKKIHRDCNMIHYNIKQIIVCQYQRFSTSIQELHKTTELQDLWKYDTEI